MERRAAQDPAGLLGRSVHVGFVIGLPRSGTTLLCYLLAGAEGSLSLSEPYLAHFLFSPWRLRRLFCKVQRQGGLKRMIVPPDADRAGLLAYMRSLASENGLKHLIVKETYRSSREWRNDELMNWLAELNLPMVATVRHPYDVAVSSVRFCRWWRGVTGWMMRMVAPRMPLFAGDREVVEHVADNWASFSRWCRARKRVILRYEDLVHHPDEALRTACDALGLRYEPRMLDPRHPRGAFGGIGDPMVMKQAGRPVRPSSVGRKNELAPALQDIIQAQCGDEAAHWEYAL